VAATRQHAPTGEIKRLRGDGLVPVASALGRHADAARCLDFAASDMALIFDCDHFDLLSNDAVGRRLLDWFGASAPA
jgi:hypothetical protein